MKIKLIYLDYLIVSLLFFLLVVDSINGYLKLSESAINLPVSQLYKTFLLLVILLRLYNNVRAVLMITTVFFILFFPSVIQLFKGSNVVVFDDFIKIIKFLTPVVCYFYFKKLFKNNSFKLNQKLFSFIQISYWILVISILLKFFGLGYSLYPNDVGSKGYFYAGNEISGVLIITYSLMLYHFLIKGKMRKFWILFLFTIIVSFVLGSKTGVLGIILITFFIKIDFLSVLNSIKKIKRLFLYGMLFLPVGLFVFYKMVLSSEVFQNRIMFFYQKMDILSLLLSSRNVYFLEVLDVYLHEYNFVEKFFGVGQSHYEYLTNKTVEIEFIDVFFTYGLLGLFIFLILLFSVFWTSVTFKKHKEYPYARLTYISLIILCIISSLAGHVFSSGMAGIFIGYIFAIQHLKRT